MNDIPSGYCQCGCGGIAPLASKTMTKRGWIKGQPLRYIKNHYWLAPERQLLERFWSRVEKHGEDECWWWTGSAYGNTKTYNHYGRIRAQKVTGSRKSVPVHWLSYEIANGPVPKGLWVLHTCDQPMCVNPKHLFAGTPLDNARDRKAKGRGATGPIKDRFVRQTDRPYQSPLLRQPDESI